MDNETVEWIDCLARIARRDARALESLYDRFSTMVFGTVLAVVKRREDAEDVLGEVFYQVWEKAGSFDPSKGSVHGWLLTLARNRAIDRIRSRSFKGSAREDGSALDADRCGGRADEDPLDRAAHAQRMERVRAALERLPADQRKVIEAAYLGGYSQSQVADRLGMPLGTVKTRMRDGMKSLQGILKDRL